MTMIPLRANRTPAAAPAKPAEPVWVNIDPDTMPEDIRGHYYTYRQAFDHAEQLRKLFESEANEAYDVGANLMLKFGYKFGRCSAAIVPRRSSAGASAVSLASLGKPR